MEVAIVSGSHRINSQSIKVSCFIQNMLKTEFPNVRTHLLDLGEHPLPDWEESKWEDTENWKRNWLPVSLQLRESAALIAVSPEWGGMVPSRLKNFFLLCEDDELAHKPGLIVSISAGRGGTYPVTELRISSYKNTRIAWIPENVIIQNVENVLNKPFSASSEADKYIQDRLLYSLRLLVKYADCLSDVRRSGIVDHEKFPYGM